MTQTAENSSPSGRKPRYAPAGSAQVKIKTMAESESNQGESLDSPDTAASLPPSRPRLGLRLFMTGFVGLLSLSFGLWLNSTIEGLFAQTPVLGWVGVVLSGCVVVGLLLFLVREGLALRSLHKVETLQKQARALHDPLMSDDTPSASAFVKELIDLYRDRPDMAHSRHSMKALSDAIMDDQDVILLCERDMMQPLDKRAQKLIAASVKKVSAVTAISPRAFLDLVFVLYETSRLLRQLSELYGAKPGTLASWQLFKHALTNLAVTGGLSASDGLIGQLLGHGVAGKISARLGEGVINGIMIARFGLAVMQTVRPVPFLTGRPPALRQLTGSLIDRAKAAEKAE
jgi:putative membrane protein